MIFVAIFGMVMGAITPLLRRYRRTLSAILLALAAAILAAPVVVNFIHPDPRIGLAAIDANRRFDLVVAGGELPVLVLALVSLKWLGKLYWVGWGIHLAMTVWLGVVFVWLEFFWHW
jgi:hypothetical protein